MVFVLWRFVVVVAVVVVCPIVLVFSSSSFSHLVS